MEQTFITFEIGLWVALISSIFRIDAARRFVKVVRYAASEAFVKNGLAVLRKQLLVSATILFFINTIGLGLLIIRPFASKYWYDFFTAGLAILNSIGFWTVARIQEDIYTQSYTPNQKILHDIWDKIEKGELKVIRVREKGAKK